MDAETHPSSSSSSDNYDVFLSFRGPDTRRNFIDHLYNALIQAGIRTFRDSEELHHGEEIGPKLLKSIEQSRISIPIFSENYASSKWCLRELTKIMEFKKTCGQIVWPIFYKVKPCHVKNQTGCFVKAFLEHKKEQCEEEVRAWSHALKEAGNLIGWDSEDPKYSLESSDLIKSVVDEALTEVIQITTLHVAKHPIGIDSHVEKVMRMLDVESQGVLFVGIHGMGGIGKTTTAKAVFNTISSQFKSRSFLADVREKASKGRGLVDLQNDLASDLLKGTNLRIGNVDHGINVIKNQFCNKKVLIVLDDVDHDEQLQALAGGCDWFGSGSRIIITTRDEHILHVDLVDKSKIYKPNELDKNLSVQLFSKHAFGRDQPPQDFMELSSRVVSIVGGLPLSLIVVGSFLRDKKEHAEWEDTLQMLKEFPQEEVQKQLKISYDGLYKVFKELFLDIACFFIGMDKESIILACDAKVGIKVLVYKSLVKIDSDNKLRMHDQLRDMGREIVRQENIKKPGKRSRLWSHKEALEVLKEYKGTRKVEGLFLDFPDKAKNRLQPEIDPADLLTKAFEKMSDLRLLQVDHAYHDGNNFGHLPQGLKWLSLKGISSKCVPTISHLEKLVVLDLSLSKITDYWDGWQQIQLISTLKVLDLSSCYYLERTPHFSIHTGLERLILDDCLVAYCGSIRYLVKLVFLSLKHCRNLTKLPNISGLSLLQQLDLVACETLKLLPKMPPGLIKLNISGCTSVERLPNLSTLKNLKELRLDECKELAEIEGIDGLTLLQELDLSDCSSIQRLPNLSTLKNLKELRLDKCKELAKIEGIDGLTLLQELDLTRCTKLQSLSELPSSLIKLKARACWSIQRLPNLSNLKNLRELLLPCCEKLSEIQGISGLSLLQQLDLSSCHTLHSLPELPPSLIRLDVGLCFSLETLPNLSTMKHSLLQELDLKYCKKLQSLPELPSSLIKLDASSCGSIETLPNLSNLKSLQVFYLCCSNLSEIQDISGLSLLWDLHLTDCKMLRYLPGLPSSLIQLEIEGCMSMVRLPIPSSLKSLKVLDLENCKNLSEIQDISELSLLQELYLKDCEMLQYLPGLPSSLIKLVIEGCMSMERIPNLSSLRSLKVLRLENCMNPANIQGINDLTLLQEIDLLRCSKLQSLSALPSSSTRIYVNHCENLFEIQGISDLSLLQTLHLRSCRELHSLDLSNLRILESLTLEDCDNLAEIRGLESLESLIHLQVLRCYTCVKTLPKTVAEGMLPPIAFNKWELRNNYLMIPDDDNIKGTIFYFVYQLLQDPPINQDVFTIAVAIQRNDCKELIRCFHDLRIEGMNSNTDKDQFYSCYFQGLTWFGFPLKKRDIIYVKNASFQTEEVKVKMLDLVIEYEAMEDSQQLEMRVVHLITPTSVEREGARQRGDDAGPSIWRYIMPCFGRSSSNSLSS